MKTHRIAIALALVTLLGTTPVLAQSRGGGSRGGSSSHSSSSSSSRGGGGISSSSRSSSSSASSSHSSSSSSRSSLSGSHDRSGTTSLNSARSRHSTTRQSATTGSPRNSATSRSERRSAVGTPASTTPRDRGTLRSGTSERTGTGRISAEPRTRGDQPMQSARGKAPKTRTGATTSGDRTGEVHPQGGSGHTYARPGHPGHMPPAARPIHPAPYFHHPYHHHMIHMRPVFWHPMPPRPIFWPGFWLYCNSYWYDYHVTDVTIVHRYVQDTYNVDMISYAISGDYMYAIVRDNGTTYLQVFDQSDKLLAEQEISSKYIKAEIDRENGGCWIFKKRDKDPMLFIYANSELLIYEAD